MSLSSQTSLDFTQVNNIDGVGELTKGSSSYDQDQKLYLDYPGVQDLIYEARKALDSGKKIKFVCEHNYSKADIHSANFLNESSIETNPFLGFNPSSFGTLMAPNFAGTTVLGNFSLAQIEAKAAKLIHNSLFGDKAVDHFKSSDGISNLNVLERAIKAFELQKNELAIFHVPDNAIKAFRAGKFSPWQYAKLEAKTSSLGKLKELDYTHKLVSEINIVDYQVSNLESPIYKVKLGDRWILVVPQSTSYDKINQKLDLSLSKESIERMKRNITLTEKSPKQEQEIKLEASLGQSVRVIFELLGANFDLIPEAMFNFEGGCFSSIVTEKSSTGRYNGTNSLHEVLKNKWHLQADIAVPWNYISFEKLDKSNQRKALINDNYIVEFSNLPGLRFLECSQNWKRQHHEQKMHKLKSKYRELTNLASKKYLLSTKELYTNVAEYFYEKISDQAAETRKDQKDLEAVLEKIFELSQNDH